MPDENKFEKLREIGYYIAPQCGFCLHGNFYVSSAWGTCKKHRYEHKKHDNPKGGRGVSIHRAGCCGNFEKAPAWNLPELGAHAEFMKE